MLIGTSPGGTSGDTNVNKLNLLILAAKDFRVHAHENTLKEDAVCDHPVNICWCQYLRSLRDLDDAIELASSTDEPISISNVRLASSIRPGNEATRAYRIALHPAKMEGTWATHVEVLVDLPDGGVKHESYHMGNYFKSYEEGIVDYLVRCKRENLQP